MRFGVTLCLILTTCFIYAQDKFEIEKRVKQTDVPVLALDNLTKILGLDHKIKWYYQQDGDKKVYEAKFEFNSKDYSVEFDTTGIIYNVEISIDYNELNSNFVSKLKIKLDQLFEEYSIRKIQIEYLGEEDYLFDLISVEEVDDDLSIQYEFEIDAKSSKKRELNELIFDSYAKLISSRKIKLKSTDILDY